MSDSTKEWPIWEVFTQKKDGAAHEHAGSVHAPDAEMALLNARDVYGRRMEAINMWVVLSSAIVASTPDDMGPFFDPANDKLYRWPNTFKTPQGIKQV